MAACTCWSIHIFGYATKSAIVTAFSLHSRPNPVLLMLARRHDQLRTQRLPGDLFAAIQSLANQFRQLLGSQPAKPPPAAFA